MCVYMYRYVTAAYLFFMLEICKLMHLKSDSMQIHIHYTFRVNIMAPFYILQAEPVSEPKLCVLLNAALAFL
jgi:hypothetical protein